MRELVEETKGESSLGSITICREEGEEGKGKEEKGGEEKEEEEKERKNPKDSFTAGRLEMKHREKGIRLVNRIEIDSLVTV
ncbi:hypothetical protein PRIPAC_73148 [Pristionchus pacificus]|uniref:Uncharacterized protein n=1 Tax=Pristionchus pacificus TaxID=54126 RepID=A0A2A6CA57_PRIPA|nr:hypothetical protein PRIPAC_73148 [Pristionchus pacificus]|eukprot:PDM75029.1 hypothetical protein PRIPAC_40410 [Pristionchus pacificus]